MASKDKNPMGDEQGTRVGKPDKPAGGSNESPHEGHAPDSLGAGAEAVTDADQHDREHRSGYGGAGGQPVESSDTRQRNDGEIL
ncbi:MAG: hypothetical protein ACYC3Q_15805 [Gemmatimonadaceae bacterium]